MSRCVTARLTLHALLPTTQDDIGQGPGVCRRVFERRIGLILYANIEMITSKPVF